MVAWSEWVKADDRGPSARGATLHLPLACTYGREYRSHAQVVGDAVFCPGFAPIFQSAPKIKICDRKQADLVIGL